MCVEKRNIAELSLKTIRPIIDTIALTTKVVSGYRRRQKKVSTKNSNTSQELFNLNGKPSFGQALPLAFQHVVAMIIGCVAPAIILAGVSGLSESIRLS